MSAAIERAAIALYDRFTHEGLDRRSFMAELSRICGGAAAAAAMLSSVAACAQATPQVAPDDPRLHAGDLDWEVRPGRHLKIYRAQPARANPRGPAVIVIHENRGLNDHIRDIARRLAVAGYDAYAPDLLTPAGGTPTNEDQARAMIGQLDMVATAADGAALIHRFAGARRKVGIVGFCWGGGVSFAYDAHAGTSKEFGASVVYYGVPPKPDQLPNVHAPVLGLYGGTDARIALTVPGTDSALKALGRTYEHTIFPGAAHGFLRAQTQADGSIMQANADATRQAWPATVAWFKKYLK